MENDTTFTPYYLETTTEGYGNKTDAHFFYQKEQIAFLCVLFVFIVTGNSLVLTIIYMSRKKRSRMNIFIGNLACADLLLGVFFVLTDLIWKITVEWYAGNVGCKIIKFVQGFACYGSTYALVALSIDRLDAIARPLSLSGKGKRCKMLVASAWIFAAVFSCPMLLTYKEFVIQDKIQCWMILPYDWMWKMYITLIAVAVFIIPAFIIAFCYTVIVVIIWKKTNFTFGNPKTNTDETTRIVSQGSKYSNGQQKRVHWTENPSSSRGVLPKAKIKTIKMTLVIVLAFILCWSPFFIFDLLFVYGNIKQTNDTIAISTFIQSLAPLNSAANPVVYILFNYKMCKGIFKKNNYNTAFASRGTAV